MLKCTGEIARGLDRFYGLMRIDGEKYDEMGFLEILGKRRESLLDLKTGRSCGDILGIRLIFFGALGVVNCTGH